MSKKEGGNIAILTDFDSSGVTMGLKVKVKNAIRIGADMNTITDLGLQDRLEKIRERVARNTHWQGIKDILDVVDGKERPNKKKDSAEAEFFRLPNELKLFYIPYFRKNIDYREHHRIELAVDEGYWYTNREVCGRRLMLANLFLPYLLTKS